MEKQKHLEQFFLRFPDADVVMFIHRDADQDQGGRREETEIMIEKHRNGPIGIVKLYFDSKKTTFLSVDKADFGDFDAKQ
jgi:replicative DNA helicase